MPMLQDPQVVVEVHPLVLPRTGLMRRTSTAPMLQQVVVMAEMVAMEMALDSMGLIRVVAVAVQNARAVAPKVVVMVEMVK